MKFGFPAIDEDHERLLSLAAEVEALIASEHSMDGLRAKFHELVEHSLGHFRREEAYMEACRYPGLPAHRREKVEVAEWLAHIEEALAGEGPGARSAATDQTLAFFRAWIGRRLMLLDKAAVRFILAESGVPQPVHSDC